MAFYDGSDADESFAGVKNDTNNFNTRGGDDTVDGGYLFDDIALGSGDDAAQGRDGSDVIDTGTGNDTVSGGEGDDIIFAYSGLAGDTKLLAGDAGDDQVVAGLGKDLIFGGTGEDTVLYSASQDGVVANLLTGQGRGGAAEGDTYTMIENVSGSNAGDRLIGNGAYNYLSGIGGNDTIRGGAGGDNLDGGSGKDILDYRTSDAGVRIDLGKGTASGGDAQGDSFTGFESVDGSDLSDRLTGDGGANRLRGFDGNDRLSGGGGGDRLSGGDGNDRLTGGKGADVLTGGKGADVFVFRSTGESGAGSSARDEIQDFRHGQHDRIDLSAIDADTAASGNQAFHFIGTAGYHGASGELRVIEKGSDLQLLGDINGDKHSDFSILLSEISQLRAEDLFL